MDNNKNELKQAVKKHWEAETCGIRYSENLNRKDFFNDISNKRYELEPYIKSFAEFDKANKKNILEIGIGAGSDFQNWCNYAKHATGIDLTEAAINLTDERLKLYLVDPHKYSIQVADSEELPFENNSFDLVYSWGVLHHTPKTEKAFDETFRVLKPNGQLKAMIYHSPSWTLILLYLIHGLGKGKINISLKDIAINFLESPGTKVYTLAEAKELLTKRGFVNIKLTTKLGPGDLLTIKPSQKYDSNIYKLFMKIYPRWLVKLLGNKFGLYLLIDAQKP